MEDYYQTSYGKDLEHKRGRFSGQYDSYLITKAELKELLRENNVAPSRIFSKEDFLNDEVFMKAIREKAELEKYRDENRELNEQMVKETEEDKLKGNENDSDLIPDDKPETSTPEQKKKQEEENAFVPDDNKKGEPGEDDDLIPD